MSQSSPSSGRTEPILNNANNSSSYQQTPSIFAQTTICCSPTPNPVTILFFTLLLTTSATAMLCAAIMTNNWELVTWDTKLLRKLVNETERPPITIEWMIGDKVARLPPENNPASRGGVFLVPMHGGIWTMCVDLTDEELRILGKHGFPRAAKCLNYLVIASAEQEMVNRDWQHAEYVHPLHPQIKMQNLSISCSLVCLIILGSAALVGTFGVCQRQLSAILVTGVMYLLAGLFAFFTLMIIHFKRFKSPTVIDTDYDVTIDGIVAARGTAKFAHTLLDARLFNTDWSVEMGWAGVGLCAITSFLWIFLSKLMRFNPLSAML